jgi:N-acetylmuramoyl-L-alanine amidase
VRPVLARWGGGGSPAGVSPAAAKPFTKLAGPSVLGDKALPQGLRSSARLKVLVIHMPLHSYRPLAILLSGLLFLAAAPPAQEKHISVYSNVATYTLPVLDRNSREYVGLLEILEPLGRVNAGAEGRRFKLRFNTTDCEFEAGKTRGKIGGHSFDLAGPFLIENSRGFVSLDSLNTLLPRFLGMPINFHENARRLFIGDVATQVRPELDSTNPPRLVLNFTAPVNPTIATEPGKLKMTFTRDPLVPPGSQTLSFDNKIITAANYSENNGAAELTINGTAPLMASFSNNGKTITVTAAPQAATGAAPAPTPTPPPATTPATSPTGNVIRKPLAVVDAAHGGSERGSALSDKLAEKDVTLGFARLLRHELETRGFSVFMLRDGDVNLTLDQRAGAANAAKAAIYISLHASSEGNGARVYTALMPIADNGKGMFRAWNSAQAPVLPLSQNVGALITSALQKKEFSVRDGAASLPPLNNLLMPAVAVELAPGPSGIADLASANYQQKAAAAIADGITPMRDRLGAQP